MPQGCRGECVKFEGLPEPVRVFQNRGRAATSTSGRACPLLAPRSAGHRPATAAAAPPLRSTVLAPDVAFLLGDQDHCIAFGWIGATTGSVWSSGSRRGDGGFRWGWTWSPQAPVQPVQDHRGRRRSGPGGVWPSAPEPISRRPDGVGRCAEPSKPRRGMRRLHQVKHRQAIEPPDALCRSRTIHLPLWPLSDQSRHQVMSTAPLIGAVDPKQT